MKSKKLETVYPKESRITPKWSKWVLIVYTIIGVVMIFLSYLGTKNETFFQSDYTIEEVVAAANFRLKNGSFRYDDMLCTALRDRFGQAKNFSTGALAAMWAKPASPDRFALPGLFACPD